MKDIKNNWPLIGNRHITDFLNRIISGGNISGSYIFQGPHSLGKTTIATAFAKSLLCQSSMNGVPCGKCSSCKMFAVDMAKKTNDHSQIAHGDFHVVRCAEDKKKISIEQIRDFIRVLNMSSFSGGYKVGIVKDAEKMSVEAFNALLKTLEEPKKKVVVILLTSDLDSFPATIVSRSQVLNFGPVKFDDIYDYLVHDYDVSREAAKEYARLALGRPALALKYFEDRDFYLQHVKRAEVFVNFFEQNIAKRFFGIEELIGSKASGQIAVRDAEEILDTWVGVLRDWILSTHGHLEFLQNCKLRETMERQSRSTDVLLKINSSIEKAREYLNANVNPKLALEFVAVNFPV